VRPTGSRARAAPVQETPDPTTGALAPETPQGVPDANRAGPHPNEAMMRERPLKKLWARDGPLEERGRKSRGIPD